MSHQDGSRRRAGVVATLLVAALALSGCTVVTDATAEGRPQAHTPFPAEINDKLNVALAEAMTLSGASGAIAGVWAPWAGEWVVSPGTTTREGKDQLTTDMRFRVAENTRAMTCTVLLKLVDEKKVSLSDPVSTYLSRAADAGDVTLGQLCQNTSGVADYTPQLAPYFINNPTREWPPLEVLSSGLALERVAPPGGVWADSNTGYVLLGLALQAATREDWNTLYHRYIFDPLGMSNSSFPSATETKIPGPHPHGYASAMNTAGQLVCETVHDETDLSNSMTWVAGGVVSSLGDMRIWAQALAEGRLLSEKSAEAQWATVPLGPDAPTWQGYGLGVQQWGPLRGQAGAIPGFLSAALTDPSSGLTIVVMLNNSNSGAGFVQSVAQRFASIASKAPSSGSEAAPLLELPWSEEQALQSMRAGAVCAPPPDVEPAPAG
ncbi:MAG: hypothetical protein JWQ68_1070 [Cryobacterium sp.]|jgi:D-alanyl-D-alanine carboxypeptidase|nr:hypothetical protein [Cryobacterium sp.]